MEPATLQNQSSDQDSVSSSEEETACKEIPMEPTIKELMKIMQDGFKSIKEQHHDASGKQDNKLSEVSQAIGELNNNFNQFKIEIQNKVDNLSEILKRWDKNNIDVRLGKYNNEINCINSKVDDVEARLDYKNKIVIEKHSNLIENSEVDIETKLNQFEDTINN